MSARILTAVCILFGLAVQAGAAEFRVEERAHSYTLEVSGTIAPGDYQLLSDLFKGMKGFPSATRINSAEGDTAEAMRIGRLYRSAHLSAMAGEDCGAACFLWLLGATSRATATDFSLQLSGAGDAATTAYLTEMGVPGNLASDLMSPGEQQLSRTDFEALVGERPESYHSWQLEHCGDATPAERDDHRSLQAAGFLQVLQGMQAADPAREDLAPIIQRYEAMSARASQFSDVYKAQLLARFETIRDCRRQTVNEHQLSVLGQL